MIPVSLLTSSSVSPHAMRAYGLIRLHSDWSTGVTRLDVDGLAQMLGVRRRRSFAILAELRDAGFAEQTPSGWKWLPHPPSIEEIRAHRTLGGGVDLRGFAKEFHGAANSAVTDHNPVQSRSTKRVQRKDNPKVQPQVTGGPIAAAVHVELQRECAGDVGLVALESHENPASMIYIRDLEQGDTVGVGIGDPQGKGLGLGISDPQGLEDQDRDQDQDRGLGGPGGKGADEPARATVLPGVTDPPEAPQAPAKAKQRAAQAAKPAKTEPPLAVTEDQARAGAYDDPAIAKRPEVISLLVEVWARDVWHRWAGKRVEPSTQTREREIRRAIEAHGRSPSGILEAFAGIPDHPFFAATLEGERGPAVEPRIALGVSSKDFAPYDELRDIVVKQRDQQRLAAEGTPDERDAFWQRSRAAWTDDVSKAVVEPVAGEAIPPAFRGIPIPLLKKTHAGVSWYEFNLAGVALTSAMRVQAVAAAAYAQEVAATTAAGKALIAKWPSAVAEARSGVKTSMGNLNRSLAKLAAARDAGTLFAEGGSHVAE